MNEILDIEIILNNNKYHKIYDISKNISEVSNIVIKFPNLFLIDEIVIDDFICTLVKYGFKDHEFISNWTRFM